MNAERSIYRPLKLLDTAKAAGKPISTGSPRPIPRRAGRVVYGKAAGRWGCELFK